jgi:hypothetical protein
MKKIFTTLTFCLLIISAFAQQINHDFVTADIDNFWAAYDKISATKDSAAQYGYINQLFIDRGTPGLKAIMQARRYTAKSYIDAINSYPLFWNSIRGNTLKARSYADEIAVNVMKLKKLYPELKPAKIYFTIGALRTGGTTLSDKVLIGSEIALGDEHTITTELPQSFDNVKQYFKTNPTKIIAFSNVHEYVHTQQKTTVCNYLLGQSVMEGVAEFMAVKATGKASTAPAIAYGPTHSQRIKEVFAKQMFNTSEGFWLYSNDTNEFGVRDLGYYVGYAICESYYNKAADKKLAIKQMITLDYDNGAALAAFVDQSGYFSKPVMVFKNKFEKARPTVTGIKQFKNPGTDVSVGINEITIAFSEEMNKFNRNFELGPLGKDNLLKIKAIKGFADDGRSITVTAELKPGQHYQIMVGAGFKSKNGAPLTPYLIDFTTAAP